MGKVTNNILTNHNNIKGAGVMLYPGELKRIAEELESDLVVFPSSIHEIIIYPLSEVCELEGLKGMVRYANGTFVNKQEILSDRVYLYKWQENRLCLAFPEEGVEAVELDRLFEVKLYACEKAERVVA